VSGGRDVLQGGGKAGGRNGTSLQGIWARGFTRDLPTHAPSTPGGRAGHGAQRRDRGALGPRLPVAVPVGRSDVRVTEHVANILDGVTPREQV